MSETSALRGWDEEFAGCMLSPFRAPFGQHPDDRRRAIAGQIPSLIGAGMVMRAQIEEHHPDRLGAAAICKKARFAAGKVRFPANKVRFAKFRTLPRKKQGKPNPVRIS